MIKKNLLATPPPASVTGQGWTQGRKDAEAEQGAGWRWPQVPALLSAPFVYFHLECFQALFPTIYDCPGNRMDGLTEVPGAKERHPRQ